MFVLNIVTRFPYSVLLFFTILTTTCLIISVLYGKIPDFSDPQLGFETRGTVLAERFTTWNNLLVSTKHSGIFTLNPTSILIQANTTNNNNKKKKKKTKKPKKFIEKSIDNPKTVRNLKVTTPPEYSEDWNFCGNPDKRYSHIILSGTDSSKTNLFSLQSLISMCHIEFKLREMKNYKILCHTISNTGNMCCLPWSIVNYVMVFNNRTTCDSILEQDVNNTLNLLDSCADYYYDSTLKSDCDENSCKLPDKCTKHNAVYNIFNYLTDIDFLPRNDSSRLSLTNTAIFLPIVSSTKMIEFYYELQQIDLNANEIQVVAMEFGLKNILFDEYLIRDTWLIGTGGFCVLLCMWLYTRSIFITFMTILAIVYSLVLSYFIYTWIFNFDFFPFMNLLAFIVALGIGVDDSFIFLKIWYSKRTQNSNTIMNYAFMSMFVTSLTTTAAFYTSYISSITTVCCFSIFAGTIVLVNFLLTTTWLPACLVISDRNQWKINWKFRWVETIEQYFYSSILNFQYFWCLLFAGLSILSLMVVFYYPQLKLPDTTEFQLLNPKHPFEQYDSRYKQQFRFEQIQQKENLEDLNSKLPLRFIWGVLPVDNGNYMNPFSKGTLELDPTFDLAAPTSQKWLFDFCFDLKTQPFYSSLVGFGLFLSNCFIESLVRWMQRPCVQSLNDISCCGISEFPYNRSIFDSCSVQMISDLYDTPASYFTSGAAGPKFSKSSPAQIQALVVEFDSNFSYIDASSYTQMDRFYREVEEWMQVQLSTAPLGMRNGWFISDLEFYDVQSALSKSTIIAICIALIISFVVLLLATLNIFISLCAMFTITLCIFSILAILVLLGWKLNVLESIAISSTVGLAVDFCLHYAVTYKFYSFKHNRNESVKYTLTNMAGPTAMAAFTTSTVAVFMLNSTVLPYIQIGVFLIVVMSVSWLYSTFCFCTILSIIGPEQGFGQFFYVKPKRSEPEESRLDEVNALSVLNNTDG